MMTAELVLELSLTTDENKDGLNLELPCVAFTPWCRPGLRHPAVPSHRDMDEACLLPLGGDHYQ